MGIESSGKQHPETTLGTKIASIITAVSLAIGTTLAIKNHTDTMRELENREGVVLKQPGKIESGEYTNNTVLIIAKDDRIEKNTTSSATELDRLDSYTIDTAKVPNDTINLLNRIKGKIHIMNPTDYKEVELYIHIHNWLHSDTIDTTDINNVFSKENLDGWFDDMDNTEPINVLIGITVGIESYMNNNGHLTEY